MEVLLAILVLAAGALMSLPALQRSLDHLRYIYTRRDAEIAVNQLITQAEWKFKTERSLRGLSREGEMTAGDSSFNYQIEVFPVNQGESLMEIQATVNWLGEGTSGLTRSAYVAD